ncbi:MAG: SDR family NAD(P)-dependent oxidoreductase [Kiritimatiellia bacterium]
MDDARVIEIAAAARMMLSRLANASRQITAPVFLSVDDSPEALSISSRRPLLEKRAALVSSRPILWLPGGIKAEELARKLEAAHRSGKSPLVVTLENEVLMAVGTYRGEIAAIFDSLLNRKAASKIRPRGRRRGRLAGHVAIVTGGAQGFGEGIAGELAGEGAAVVVADLNDRLGESVAARLNRDHGPGTALFCHTDVTDAESMRRCVMACVRTFGGVDLFIANAGILRAGGISETDEATFDLVTNVNYKAFFLGVRAVVPVMQAQHSFAPDYFMDIIHINSKSGLQGSNRNFAYAGSKFGAIGLVQSFALELLPYRIKVNAICPGNYFDGPLWSDPEQGLFVQYLRAGKVPGATTIEDVRRFYLSKVPMGRGCLPSDLAKAVLYLHEQEYETGQALPVTGGQVMLK